MTRSNQAVLSDMPAFRESIVKRSVKDAIGNKIATLIASGILRVGDTLPSERELAVALNVSRESVRGAIQTLAVRGILEISHGARTRVVNSDVGSITVATGTPRAIDAYDIETVHAARLLIERELVADAATLIDDSGLAVLDNLLTVQSEAQEDPVRFLISDREFHVAVYRTARNALLADMACDLYAYMMQHRREAVAIPGAIAASIRDHVAIVAALRRRDSRAAVRAFRKHTERIYVTTRSVLGVGGGTGKPSAIGTSRRAARRGVRLAPVARHARS